MMQTSKIGSARRAPSVVFAVICLVAMAAAVARAAEPSGCSRACLGRMADELIASIARHDPARLPLVATYAASENGVPAALPMMSAWRMASGVGGRLYVLDPVYEQAFFMVSVREGATDALLYGRFKAEGGKFAEIELYIDRSRGDGGFMFDGNGPAHLPRAWTEAIAARRLPSRSDLVEAGRSMFDPAIAGPPIAPACRLMENGRLVAESPRVLKWVDPSGQGLHVNADGSVPIPCGSPADRPADPTARTVVVDTAQGIVVSIASVQGLVQPYLITDPTVSAFIPLSLLNPYMRMLDHQRGSGQFSLPALRGMAASNTTVEMYRIFDGKLQGMHLLEHLEPPGALSPWERAASR